MIISPYLSHSTVDKLLNHIKNQPEKLTFITTFDRENFTHKSNSLDALELLIKAHVNVYILQNLHTKLYLFNEQICLFGSANFTNNGLNHNHELLTLFDQPNEVSPYNDYAKGLLQQIQASGDWLLTLEKIEEERKAISEIKIPPSEPKQQATWGAVVIPKTTTDQQVLSVSAGKTLSIVEKTSIHAHPDTSNYKYRPTKFITFRKDGGGAMNHIYKIEKIVLINMWEWQEIIQQMDLSITEKARLTDYINSRFAIFEISTNKTYKFYFLERYINLPNSPRPYTQNTAKQRYYRLESLINSTGLVKPISQE